MKSIKEKTILDPCLRKILKLIFHSIMNTPRKRKLKWHYLTVLLLLPKTSGRRAPSAVPPGIAGVAETPSQPHNLPEDSPPPHKPHNTCNNTHFGFVFCSINAFIYHFSMVSCSFTYTSDINFFCFLPDYEVFPWWSISKHKNY